MDQQQLKIVRCRAEGQSSDYLNFIADASGVFVLLKKSAVSTLTQLNICFKSSTAIIERNSRYRDQAAVIMMLLSGKTQISEAIESVGIGENERDFLVAYSNNDDIEKFSKLKGIESIEPETGIPSDDRSIDSKIFPLITDVIYDLNRSH